MFFKSKKGKVTWKANDEGYFFYKNGEDVGSDTLNVKCGDHALVYLKENNGTYFLENFSGKRDMTERPAKLLADDDTVFWVRDGDGFRVIIQGIDMAPEAVNIFNGDDLLVYLEENNTTYLLHNFKKAKENNPQKAEVLSDTDYAFWTAEKDNFIVFYKGKSITGNIDYARLYDSMIIYYETDNATIYLENYWKKKDGRLRPARILSTTDTAFWLKDGNGFKLLDKARPIHGESTNSRIDHNILVYHEKSGATYFIPNFFSAKETELFPAIILSRRAEVVWRASNNRYEIWYHGKKLTKGLSHQPLGNDLAVMSDELNLMMHLPGFRQKQDNKLRAVEQ